jgi:hypothetical protein
MDLSLKHGPRRRSARAARAPFDVASSTPGCNPSTTIFSSSTPSPPAHEQRGRGHACHGNAARRNPTIPGIDELQAAQRESHRSSPNKSRQCRKRRLANAAGKSVRKWVACVLFLAVPAGTGGFWNWNAGGRGGPGCPDRRWDS